MRVNRQRAAMTIMTGALLLAACQAKSHGDPDLTIDKQKDPSARYFEGQIISLRPTIGVMLISSGKEADELNIVECRYDAHSQFYVDGKPAGLTEIGKGMPAKVKGHMQGEGEGHFVIDVAKFSSVAKS